MGALNDDDKPHNPLVNTGAIVSCALIEPTRPMDERFDRMQSAYREAAGGKHIGYCNQHFARERRDSDRSYCLAYMLREKGCFPNDSITATGLSVQETLDVFFMVNSIEMDVEALSVVAATLANNGVCPITNKRVFSAPAVRNCLSMMSSCGLGDFSGEFAFHVGLPGKSSRSGFTLLVVPGVSASASGHRCWIRLETAYVAYALHRSSCLVLVSTPSRTAQGCAIRQFTQQPSMGLQ